GLEAGSRQIERIHQTASGIREALFRNHMKQAELMGTLVKQIRDLQACVKQQHATMRDLRRDIRTIRDRS
ncbi:MAG TPA: hypothetical protein VHZ73_02415, partial [Vicinamibacterales bacterium]|nr:hypothetical protein [Vicinamibacterales bacterium]